MIHGSCHCQQIKFEITVQALTVRYCYCQTCRKLSAADYSVVAHVDCDQFALTRGAGHLLSYESRPGKWRYYCDHCFAPIYVVTNNEPDFLRVRMGLLDSHSDGLPNGKLPVAVTGHMWVSEKPAWRSIDDGLPVYLYEYTGD
ncbi:GFA family protein [Halioxenophilus sp. WMMB6]|uniref:GFA family protein n=1 Tax=Halioxenophilus sp. WMMB6 TaxID=3073815 RepID=UPI00295F065C|nr:GFA family protein [Halioxenophilus sp. WMMB6]